MERTLPHVTERNGAHNNVIFAQDMQEDLIPVLHSAEQIPSLIFYLQLMNCKWSLRALQIK